MNRFTRFAILPLALASSLAVAGDFRLTSRDIADGQPMAQRFAFQGFGCTGENRSPALAWSGAPAATKGYALTVYDPDAPTGSGWWHWVLLNIPATTTALPSAVGSETPPVAGALQLKTDYGVPGYGGPCPPVGDKPHHYIFTVFALDTGELELPENATPALAGFMLRGHTLAKASLTATYGR